MSHSTDPLDQLLREHGQENIFSLLSQQECEALLRRLEEQADTEEQLSQQAATFVDEQHLWAACEPEVATPPQGLPALVQEPPRAPKRHLLGWMLTGLSVCTLMTGWSLFLYSFAYQQGLDKGAKIASINQTHTTHKQPSNTKLARHSEPQETESPQLKWAITMPLHLSLKKFREKTAVASLASTNKARQRAGLLENEQRRLLVEQNDLAHFAASSEWLLPYGSTQSYRIPKHAGTLSLSLWRKQERKTLTKLR